MKWQRNKKLGIIKFTEEINKMSENIVKDELKDLNNKILSLHKMGIIKDKESIKKLQEKMDKL